MTLPLKKGQANSCGKI